MKRVMIGMSGGVDSSVAAYLLKKQGYEVIGVTMKLWQDDDNLLDIVDGGCCSEEAVNDARKVCEKLDIPFYVLNFSSVFKEKVIKPFIDEYLNGRTPNPCIACNKHIKFDDFYNKAIQLGCDYVATGHYAKIEFDGERYQLKKSVTDKKDQTYALYNLTQEQLEHTLLPIGEYEKEVVREIAKEIGIEVHNKPDSQEICFVKDNDYAGYVKRHSKKRIEEGYFVDTKGNVLGKHKGIINYTIGQRKGLGIAFGKPMFVVDIDPIKNTVVLGDNEDIFKKGLLAKDFNLISIDDIKGEIRVTAKHRYSAKPSPATLTKIDNDTLKIVFDEPQRAITKGQSVVMYDGDKVLGGGIIDKSID